MANGRSNVTVLQVLPSLITGGVERGTIEITQAIADAGWTALVASAGGRLVSAVQRRGRLSPAVVPEPAACVGATRRGARSARKGVDRMLFACAGMSAGACWRTGAHSSPAPRRMARICQQTRLQRGWRGRTRITQANALPRSGAPSGRSGAIRSSRGVDPAAFDPRRVPW
jgi:hypothetical protein